MVLHTYGLNTQDQHDFEISLELLIPGQLPLQNDTQWQDKEEKRKKSRMAA